MTKTKTITELYTELLAAEDMAHEARKALLRALRLEATQREISAMIAADEAAVARNEVVVANAIAAEADEAGAARRK